MHEIVRIVIFFVLLLFLQIPLSNMEIQITLFRKKIKPRSLSSTSVETSTYLFPLNSGADDINKKVKVKFASSYMLYALRSDLNDK